MDERDCAPSEWDHARDSLRLRAVRAHHDLRTAEHRRGIICTPRSPLSLMHILGSKGVIVFMFFITSIVECSFSIVPKPIFAS